MPEHSGRQREGESRLVLGSRTMEPTKDLPTTIENAHENVRRLCGHKHQEAVVDYYNKWIEDGSYDTQLKEGYNGPNACAVRLAKYMGENKDIQILDIGAGSGLVAEELVKFNFKNIDGVEPSGGMVEKAEEKKLYNTIFNVFFTENNESMESDAYDAIVSSGSFGVGHMPTSVIPEMIRITKPGGYVIIASSGKGGIATGDEVPTTVRKLEAEGKLECIESEDLPNYYFDRQGYIHVCKVLN